MTAGPGHRRLGVCAHREAEGADGVPGPVCWGGIRGHHALQDRSGQSW